MGNEKLDLIDRNALYEKAYFHGKLPDPGCLYPDGKEAVDVDDIDDAPSIDAVPVVHGHWILRKENSIYDMTYQYECSQCAQPNRSQTNYCPNCGSKMNGDAK